MKATEGLSNYLGQAPISAAKKVATSGVSAAPRTKSVKKVRSWPADEFLKREFPPKEAMIPGLLHRRDLVTFAGRRRHGKTTLLTNLCVALALPLEMFLGYEIPQSRRSLMLFLEDDPGEFQEKIKRIVSDRDTGGRIRIVMRDDFYEADTPIHIRSTEFKKCVRDLAQDHKPDLIVVDNLAHVIGADYNDPKLIHSLMVEVYNWTKEFNAAVILAAHPRKEDLENPVYLDQRPEAFFETVMGSSHLVNSTGSLWGLQRRDDLGYSVFLGGRQRAEGQQGYTILEKNDEDWLVVLPDAIRSEALVNHTEIRKQAFMLLPSFPGTFGYREGEELVKPVMKSRSTYAAWMRDLRRHKLIEETHGKLCKKGGGR